MPSRILLAVMLALALFAVPAPEPASAGSVTRDFIVKCKAGPPNPQYCLKGLKFRLKGPVDAVLVTNSEGCSTVLLHIWRDGDYVGTATAPPGHHLILPLVLGETARFALYATGVDGGCNNGKLFTWSARLELFTP